MVVFLWLYIIYLIDDIPTNYCFLSLVMSSSSPLFGGFLYKLCLVVPPISSTGLWNEVKTVGKLRHLSRKPWEWNIILSILFMKSQVRRRVTKDTSSSFHKDVKAYVCTFVFSLSFIVLVFCLARNIHPSHFSFVVVCYSCPFNLAY